MYTDIDLKEADGKTRRLRFNIPAFRSLEDALGGRPIGQVVLQLSQLSFTATIVALWAGLKHEDRKLTVRDVEGLLEHYVEDGGDLTALTRTLNDAIGDSAAFKAMSTEKNAPKETTTA